MIDGVGWLATAVFLCSYFAKQPTTLRRIQGIAASLWATYGILIHSWPVIVARNRRRRPNEERTRTWTSPPMRADPDARTMNGFQSA